MSLDHFQFDVDNNILANTGRSLIKLSPAGEQIAKLEASDLGLSGIQSFAQLPGGIALMGISTGNRSVLRLLDNQYAQEDAVDLGPAHSKNLIVASGDAGLCFMTAESTEQSAAIYTVGYFHLEQGVVWSASQNHQGLHFTPQRVASDRNHCYFSYTDAPGDDPNPTTHYVQRFTHAGKALTPVKLDAAIGADFVIDRNHIITAAMSSEYDGSYTFSLLVKHRVR